MIDTEDTAIIVRISGIALSILSAVIMFIKPFEYVTNTLTVYFLLIAASVLVIVGQVMTIVVNKPADFKSSTQRHEAIYDAISIGIVIVLFCIFFVIPFILKHTSWLS
ncbi:MAG: hypothetical protein JWN28_583 [Candidatus Saccharibacteria bacterium]|nr:hypothetical protein [Candidatus Saccharibacteria bacterium]